MSLIINLNNDTWRVLSTGTVHEGLVYCHLASTTRGADTKAGRYPIQAVEWVPQEIILSAAITKEESERKDFCRNGPHRCVPWRGAGGEIGKCVYCGDPALKGKE